MRIMRVMSTSMLFVTLTLCASASDRPESTPLSNLPAAAQASISAALGRDESQFHLRAVGEGFEARTRSQRLDTRFTAQGVEVSSGTVRWSIALQGYGYGEALKAVQAVTPEANLNRAEYRRGSLTEWYVNGPMGLEQGFTLSERPGQPHSQPLTLTLALRGDLTVSVDEGGKSLRLFDSTGKAQLRYAGLSARDATGKELNTWLEIRGERVLLRVDDEGARYPVIVDPFVQLAELTSSDGAEFSIFGWGCAISGNTVVVSSLDIPAYHGAAYVFVKPASGWANMTQTAELTSSDGAASDYFGIALAISGNTVIVGAYTATVGSNQGQGAAYVFVEPAGGWVNMTETAKLTASDGVANDGFGDAVAISGNTAVIGAYANIGGNAGQGAVYVYNKPASGWKTTSRFRAKLTASDGAANDALSNDVGISGNTIVAGAPFAAIGGNAAQGATYVFVEPATGGWVSGTQTAKLTVLGGASNDYFGSIVGISGNTVVASSYNAAVGTHASQGAAYVFVEPANGWTNATQNAKLVASDGQANDHFGIGLAITGGTVLVGAPGATIGSNAGKGALYEYLKPASGWKNTSRFNAKFTASDGTANAQFGSSAAISGNTFVVGADEQTFGSNLDQGTAYVFEP